MLIILEVFSIYLIIEHFFNATCTLDFVYFFHVVLKFCFRVFSCHFCNCDVLVSIFPFFVYCHIVWRLQLLDDLHLEGLPLHDAKVTKQLWKERSCE